MKYKETIFIAGEPKAQKRHRTVRIGNFNRNYDPSAADKGDFLSQIKKEAPWDIILGPIKVDITFHFSRPKSHYGTGNKSNILKPNAPHYHTCKPDRDNLDKMCLDSMSKVFWRDDSQVCTGTLTKVYSTKPGIEITVEEL
jgi:Holliday junction resolvase RusA-like endonuclease